MCNGSKVGELRNGEKGETGETGATGATGEKGETGATGATGADGKDGKDGKDGTSCTVVASTEFEGFDVMCGGSKVGVLVNGKDGKDGNAPTVSVTDVDETTDHPNGGVMIVVTYIDALGNVMRDTTYVWNGADGQVGQNGADGSNGTDGSNGADGYSPVVKVTNVDATDDHPNGGLQIIITYKNSAGEVVSDTSYVWNGANGQNGTNGANGKDGYSPTVTSTILAATAEHPNGGVEVSVTYKDANGVAQTTKYTIWNGANGTNGIDGSNGNNGADGYSPTVETSTVDASADHPNGGVMIVITYKDGEGNFKSDTSYVWNGADAVELSEACKTLRATEDHFIDIPDVFGCLLPGEKIAIVVRHGERGSATGRTGDLNENGFDQARFLGERVGALGLENFYYMSTDVYRTMNTVVKFSQAKGENFMNFETYKAEGDYSDDHYQKSSDFTEEWYKRPEYSNYKNCAGTDSWGQYSRMAYDTTACKGAFYNVDDKVKEIVKKYFEYDKMQNYTMVASHDQFVAPFLIAVTNRKIGLDFHKYGWNNTGFRHWPNYLSGVAIIVNSKNEVDYVPVKGLKTGYLGEHCYQNLSQETYAGSTYKCSQYY